MRKLRACVHIKAPVQTVTKLAGADHRDQWMTARSSFLRTMTESWEATEEEGGTQFTLKMEYRAMAEFIEPLVSERFSHAITQSLSRLKQMAESLPHLIPTGK